MFHRLDERRRLPRSPDNVDVCASVDEHGDDVLLAIHGCAIERRCVLAAPEVGVRVFPEQQLDDPACTGFRGSLESGALGEVLVGGHGIDIGAVLKELCDNFRVALCCCNLDGIPVRRSDFGVCGQKSPENIYRAVMGRCGQSISIPAVRK